MDREEAARAFGEFAAVIKALRTPGAGCPWDLEQTHETLRSYLIEEAYEVLEALDSGDDRSVQEELGDLLLQVVLHAQVADDRGAFSITEVIRGITEKMVRRHPHVFGTAQVSGSAEVLRNWDRIKAEEKQTAVPPDKPLGRLPASLPALFRAQRLGEKAAKINPERKSLADLVDQVGREWAGMENELASLEEPPRGKEPTTAPEKRRQFESKFGDLLFDLAQIARRVGLNAEDNLRACNRRFEDHFRPGSPPG